MHGNDFAADVANDVVAAALRTLHGILPDQGPIGVFVHHNTLHAFQHLPFEQAVVEAAAVLGTRAFPDARVSRVAWQQGGFDDKDVDAVLAEFTDDVVGLGLTRRQLRRALLAADLDVDDDAGAAFAGRGDAVYARALALAKQLPPAARAVSADDVGVSSGVGSGGNEAELLRLTLAFLDRGQGASTLPLREKGFLHAACAVWMRSAPRGAAGLDKDAALVVDEGRGARAVVDDVCAGLGEDAQRRLLISTALRLRGVAGMFSRFERHPEEAPAPTTLLEFLAVSLLLSRRVQAGPLRKALQGRGGDKNEEGTPSAAWLLRGLAVAARSDLSGVDVDEAKRVLDEARAFDATARERSLWRAWERGYRRRVLGGIEALRKHKATTTTTTTTTTGETKQPAAQVICCIDEREESFRRALEEGAVDIDTFGAAGFFGMAIDYKGVDDHEAAAYCPVVVVPGHEVHEAPTFTARSWHAARARWRSGWHGVERFIARASRGLVGGFGASVFFGPVAAVVAAGRVVAPKTSLAAWQRLTTSLAPAPSTRLGGMRLIAPVSAIKELTEATQKPMGFSLDEAADRVTALLKNIGLVSAFAPVVVVFGHGSTSLNNPHESAHDCGACGGRRGGANARLFAALANRSDVRAAVKARGVTIPESTWFIGGVHDTASDAVVYYDLEDVPGGHAGAVDVVKVAVEVARKESARERCRRFLHAPLRMSANDALAHVETRSSHLGQPRPEYGHCTNASAIVGRRALTRGLHLDRRAFLISYDPSIDDDGALVERVLAAVGPVGAGINLEYYFSSIDNEGYGCGTKLPHNVTGLLGVMNGHQSDLRTGLPLQMVELHEPLRLLLIVEATPERLLQVAGKQAEVRELVVNGWVQLVSCDPHTGQLRIFENGKFVDFASDEADAALDVVAASADHHGDARGFVVPAIVTASLQRAAGRAP